MLTKLLDPRKSTAHLKNLKKYTTYTVTVSAVTDEGLGDISEPVNVTTLEDGTFTMLRALSLKQFFLIFFISFLKLSPGQLKCKGPLNDFDFFPDIRSVSKDLRLKKVLSISLLTGCRLKPQFNM